MEVVKSEKKKLGIMFLLLWIAVGMILIGILVSSYNGYAKYKKAQEAAVAITRRITNKFEDDANDYGKMVRNMYDFYNAVPYRYLSSYADYVSEMRDLDKQLGDFLEKMGLGDEYWGSHYLECVGFWDYTTSYMNGSRFHLTLWEMTAGILALVHLWYVLDRRKTLLVVGDKIICKKGKKSTKEFLVKDVKSVAMFPIKGLKISGNGVRHRINLVKNRDEIKSVIMEKLAAQSAESNAAPPQDDPAVALIKYKELLDSGAITQEEFDAKKKQLLGV